MVMALMKKFRLLMLTNKGCERFACDEVQELIDIDNKSTNDLINDVIITKCIVDGGVIVDNLALEQLLLLVYRSQSALRFLLVLDETNTGNILDDVSREKVFESWRDKIVSENITERICVQCFNRPVKFLFENELMTLFSESLDVGFQNPSVVLILAFCGEQAFIGIDLAGDSGKRSYKMFLDREGLKNTVAYAVCRFAGIKNAKDAKNEEKEEKDKIIIADPFCRSGGIAIECALWLSNTSPRKFSKDDISCNLPSWKNIDISSMLDKFDSAQNISKVNRNIINITALDEQFSHISSAKKNAKIASVEKFIKFSRKELDWFELAFEDNSITQIISLPPQVSTVVNSQKIANIYSDFFKQSRIVLAKNGIIVFAMKRGIDLLSAIAKKESFEIAETVDVMQGTEKVVLVKIINKSKNLIV